MPRRYHTTQVELGSSLATLDLPNGGTVTATEMVADVGQGIHRVGHLGARLNAGIDETFDFDASVTTFGSDERGVKKEYMNLQFTPNQDVVVNSVPLPHSVLVGTQEEVEGEEQESSSKTASSSNTPAANVSTNGTEGNVPTPVKPSSTTRPPQSGPARLGRSRRASANATLKRNTSARTPLGTHFEDETQQQQQQYQDEKDVNQPLTTATTSRRSSELFLNETVHSKLNSSSSMLEALDLSSSDLSGGRGAGGASSLPFDHNASVATFDNRSSMVNKFRKMSFADSKRAVLKKVALETSTESTETYGDKQQPLPPQQQRQPSDASGAEQPPNQHELPVEEQTNQQELRDKQAQQHEVAPKTVSTRTRGRSLMSQLLSVSRHGATPKKTNQYYQHQSSVNHAQQPPATPANRQHASKQKLPLDQSSSTLASLDLSSSAHGRAFSVFDYNESVTSFFDDRSTAASMTGHFLNLSFSNMERGKEDPGSLLKKIPVPGGAIIQAPTPSAPAAPTVALLSTHPEEKDEELEVEAKSFRRENDFTTVVKAPLPPTAESSPKISQRRSSTPTRSAPIMIKNGCSITHQSEHQSPSKKPRSARMMDSFCSSEDIPLSERRSVVARQKSLPSPPKKRHSVAGRAQSPSPNTSHSNEWTTPGPTKGSLHLFAEQESNEKELNRMHSTSAMNNRGEAADAETRLFTAAPTRSGKQRAGVNATDPLSRSEHRSPHKTPRGMRTNDGLSRSEHSPHATKTRGSTRQESRPTSNRKITDTGKSDSGRAESPPMPRTRSLSMMDAPPTMSDDLGDFGDEDIISSCSDHFKETTRTMNRTSRANADTETPTDDQNGKVNESASIPAPAGTRRRSIRSRGRSDNRGSVEEPLAGGSVSPSCTTTADFDATVGAKSGKENESTSFPPSGAPRTRRSRRHRSNSFDRNEMDASLPNTTTADTATSDSKKGGEGVSAVPPAAPRRRRSAARRPRSSNSSGIDVQKGDGNPSCDTPSDLEEKAPHEERLPLYPASGKAATTQRRVAHHQGDSDKLNVSLPPRNHRRGGMPKRNRSLPTSPAGAATAIVDTAFAAMTMETILSPTKNENGCESSSDFSPLATSGSLLSSLVSDNCGLDELGRGDDFFYACQDLQKNEFKRSSSKSPKRNKSMPATITNFEKGSDSRSSHPAPVTSLSLDEDDDDDDDDDDGVLDSCNDVEKKGRQGEKLRLLVDPSEKRRSARFSLLKRGGWFNELGGGG